MAKPSNSEDYTDENPSNGSAYDEDQENGGGAATVEEEEVDEEEIEAVARTAGPEDEEVGEGNSKDTEDNEDAGDGGEDEDGNPVMNTEISKRERARLKEMQRLKKQKIQEILDAQNAAIDADMNNKGKGRLNYLLQKTKNNCSFCKRGRHASKLTEEEEYEEYIKEEEDALSGTGGTRLMMQPSCIQGKMRDYQLARLNWLIRLYENGINGILADEMGLGKDIADHLFVGLSLRVQRYYWTTYGSSPKVYPWKLDEGDKVVLPCPSGREISGNPDERKYIREKLLVAGKFDVCVTSFEMAIKEKKSLRHFSWRYVIIDEAHWIKNENSLLSKTMRMYA